MKIVALHLAMPVDGMRVIPATVASIVHDGDAFVVALGSRIFRVPRALCVVEGVEEAPAPAPVTVPEAPQPERRRR